MDEENKEDLDSQNQEEGGSDDQNSQQTPEEITQKNKELFARAKKAEEENKSLKAKLQELEQEAPGKNKGESAKETTQAAQEKGLSVEDFLAMRRAKLSDEEIANVVSKAKELGVSPTKLVEDETFKLGLERQREKAQVEQTTPPPSNRAAVLENKSWDQLTPEERAKPENVVKAFEASAKAKEGKRE